MKSFAAVALVVAMCLTWNGVQADTTSDTKVVVLTDDTFEHLTQAASGATTGDWFIKFYAPWCGFCKRMKQDWEDLAERLYGEINVAEVDCTKNSATCQRFSVRGYPTLLYLSHGKMFAYQSGKRTVEDLSTFVSQDFKSRTDGKPVPAPPSMFAQYFSRLESFINNVHWHSDPIVNALLIGVAISTAILVPFFFILMIYSYCFGSGDSSEHHHGHAHAKPQTAEANDEQEASAEEQDQDDSAEQDDTSASADKDSQVRKRAVAKKGAGADTSEDAAASAGDDDEEAQESKKDN